MLATHLESHEIAEVFPAMEGPDFEALREDIRARGQVEPIWVYGDKILDGRNRARACAELGIAPEVRVYSGADPVGFAVSLNLKRRHLSESQRAMIADRIACLARGRTRRGGGPPDAQICASGAPPAPSQAEAAAMLGVSRRSVQSARRVRERAAPALREAVERGEVRVSAAAEVAGLPAGVQEAAVAGGSVPEAAAGVRRGRSRVNGVVQDDPADVARLRADGKIPAGAAVEVTNPTREPGDDGDEAGGAAGLDDRAWLESLASRRAIEPSCLPTFDADALLYRALEPQRKAFAYHATRAINRARRKAVYAYRVQRFLAIDHPRHWLRCPPMAADAGAGCGGSGYLAIDGTRQQCPKCKGRGYWVR